MFNANIIVSLQGIMYVHNRWQPCACVHMCAACCATADTHLKYIFIYIYSFPHAYRHTECQWQLNRAI